MEYKDELLFKYFSASMNAWPYLHRPGSEERSKVCTVVPFFLNTNSSYSSYTVDTESEFPYLSAKLRRRNLENRNHVFFFLLFRLKKKKKKKNNHFTFRIPTRIRDFSWKCNANQGFFRHSKGAVLIFSFVISILLLCHSFPELTAFLSRAKRDACAVMR